MTENPARPASTTQPTRRAALRAAGWSVPVIALAVATPALAASETDSVGFAPSTYVNHTGLGTIALTGYVSGPVPAVVLLHYSPGFSGPGSAPIQADGTFVVPGVTCPSAVVTGTVIASIDGYTAGTATISVTDPEPRSGSIAFNPAQYRGTRNGSRVDFPTLTGTVSVTGGPLPAQVVLSFSEPSPGRVDLRRDAGFLVPIDPQTGAFDVTGVYNAIVGGDNPSGFIYAGVQNPELTFGLSTAELDG
ncbi:hypothetical protein C5E02_06140 [Rathayibacter rathayi]|uniref:DUF4397 domain-containing protein n=1 Tax=Rathayibacter rathayi TaxID=33887 RepID=A0ABD6WAI7_RATRA|nr:hypothetical protein [Rathayibacter rathayi]AZZ48862.1 hypothetical protein C1O28_06370 [Rathayibacter rathayi]MWV73957.1 hypothetical protein [Rathayibacter rathayi NCPPB 2980 = VKM Ac-1601]PPF15355.1 hypothetical protein C5C04_03755 [Rathayibacter rathayi]PPF49536.1 hypothetical protein C5C08_07185 [Rathayibacter rathayi]PPF80253.1 hypothetical protein C5C14_07025 [Rathayibacter rathayi]